MTLPNGIRPSLVGRYTTAPARRGLKAVGPKIDWGQNPNFPLQTLFSRFVMCGVYPTSARGATIEEQKTCNL